MVMKVLRRRRPSVTLTLTKFSVLLMLRSWVDGDGVKCE